ncbi:MAG: GNAT family N-acetyltransferase [Oscillospiraceae bacterium]|nr:GNAT family N-acetyltransferase [Oscillospiraceae bacterium]
MKNNDALHANLLTFRRADMGDIELLVATRVEFFAERLTEMTDDEKTDMNARLKSYFESAMGDGSFVAFLAFDGERLAATSGVNFYTNPPNPRNLTGRTAYISNMYTKPEYRGMGAATRLFDMTVGEARARGCGKATLVATEMGRPIYEKYGFTAPNNVMDYNF